MHSTGNLASGIIIRMSRSHWNKISRIIRARLGEHMIGQTIDCNEDEDCAPPVQDIDIQCIIYHPRASRFRMKNDIALVRLEKRVDFKDHIQPICLPTKPILRKMELPRYIITGWGSTEEEDESPVLLKGFISTIDLARCQMIARNTSTELVIDTQFCSEGTHEAAGTRGDNGAPVGYTVKHNGIRFVQFGICSYSIESHNASLDGREYHALGWYHVYTNVSSHMDWILANIAP
nr:CLIP domain-containing serine protease 2-like [Aedes albopictus]